VPRTREKLVKKKAPKSSIVLDDDELRLFETLREIRKQLAEESNVPPYVIFGDATLIEICRTRPANNEEFLDITGVGQVKLERYGEIFLETVARDETG
jgi:ATP-dependent DNA helicase RecQ